MLFETETDVSGLRSERENEEKNKFTSLSFKGWIINEKKKGSKKS